MTNASIFHIITSKFSYKEEPRPIVLIVSDKNLGIDLYNTVLLFNLVIILKIKNS